LTASAAITVVLVRTMVRAASGVTPVRPAMFDIGLHIGAIARIVLGIDESKSRPALIERPKRLMRASTTAGARPGSAAPAVLQITCVARSTRSSSPSA
jgi:hypothetical protein